ncbi:hypothetical protein CLOM621_06745 [Clostridium sp. M62/1]|nr:hypothetical protein CLOM621_06745 [Clostridium sp. M62/1]
MIRQRKRNSLQRKNRPQRSSRRSPPWKSFLLRKRFQKKSSFWKKRSFALPRIFTRSLRLTSQTENWCALTAPSVPTVPGTESIQP